ncbi:hypothetical protein MKX03_025254 [Papaver bracteatum]|nr:hypothetical protein MKX03_025254 [Papaver bracteatum]
MLSSKQDQDGVGSVGIKLLRALAFSVGIPQEETKAMEAEIEAARFANGGAYPPNLSLITKARYNGQNYVFPFLLATVILLLAFPPFIRLKTLDILTMETGVVQNSPADKSVPETDPCVSSDDMSKRQVILRTQKHSSCTFQEFRITYGLPRMA